MNNQPILRKDRLAEFTLVPEFSDDSDSSCKARIKIHHETHTEDISTDYTLPDYLPEIKKLLKTSVSLSPLSRYISGSEAEFSGQAEYDILYSTPDGKLSSAHIGCDFDYSVPIVSYDPSADGAVDAISDIESESVYCRVTAPRRVNIKNRLRTVTDIYCEKMLGETVPATQKTETLKSNITSSSVFRYMSEIIDVGDTISLNGENKIKDPIMAEASLCIKDTSCEENCILVKGDVLIKLLYENGEGNPTSLTKKIPINESISAEGVKPSDLSNAHGKCSEVKLDISDDSIEVSTEVIIESEAIRSEDVTVVEDIFSEKCSCHADFTPIEYETLLSSDTFLVSEKGSAKFNDIGFIAGSDVIDSGITLRVDGIDGEDEKCIISITAKGFLVTKLKDNGEFGLCELSFPIKCSIPVSSANPIGNAYASLKDYAFSFDGDSVLCECDIAVSYRIFSKSTVKALSSVSFGDDYEKTSGGIIVYYPASKESLWEIGKNYHISPRRIAERNSLPYTNGRETVPQGKKYLIIS